MKIISWNIKGFLILLAIGLFCFLLWQAIKKPETTADWRSELAVQSTAEFKGDVVLVKNVRNFRYSSTEENNTVSYYDQEYDLNNISRAWFIVTPFKSRNYAAHTFLSFEFSDGKYLTITIEARKKKGQNYSLLLGALRTYPLIYIAADERDAIMLRADVRKDDVYLYPVKATPPQVRLLFVDMLNKMNSLVEKPEWYNTFTANCTSMIAYHVNNIWPKLLPKFVWQAWVTGYAEKLVFDEGLIDTNLSFQQARQKYYITSISQQVGDVPEYSKKIRNFDQ